MREWGSISRKIPMAFRLAMEADRGSVLALAACMLLLAMTPALQAWMGKLIVDGVVLAVQQASDPRQGLAAVMPYILAEFAIIFLNSVLAQRKRLAEQALGVSLAQLLNTRIMQTALRLELHQFENDEFYNKMQVARAQSSHRPIAIITSVFTLMQNLLALLTFIFILLAFSVTLTLLLFAAAIPLFLIQNRYSRTTFRLQSLRAPEARQMNYLEQLLTNDVAAKEMKVFALGQTMIERHASIFMKLFDEDMRLAKRHFRMALLWDFLANTGFYVAYVFVIFSAIARDITLGGMTLYLSLFRQSQGIFQSALDQINRLYENGLFMDNIVSFLDLPGQQLPPQLEHDTRGGRSGFEFRNVSFRYPGQEKWAIRNLNLAVPSGQKLALVGENGSGKSTLIKLLCNLYRPTEGEILLDGMRLQDHDPLHLHRKIGVLFQDFVHYHATLRENIGFGAVEHLGDAERILDAARHSGADEVIAQLSKGMDTVLGRQFHEGLELSGGQWQKVALGRALLRDSEILVLDEPTAAIDAESEFHLFDRISDLTIGKTVILVSHRFGAVRMADRILVLRKGEVEESGSHDELMAKEGYYARLFRMQASGYR
jgi:ATP-binding cassette subfamily B protein